jgi:hypothetical protein
MKQFAVLYDKDYKKVKEWKTYKKYQMAVDEEFIDGPTDSPIQDRTATSLPKRKINYRYFNTITTGHLWWKRINHNYLFWSFDNN